jgi:hypothetical protein
MDSTVLFSPCEFGLPVHHWIRTALRFGSNPPISAFAGWTGLVGRRPMDVQAALGCMFNESNRKTLRQTLPDGLERYVAIVGTVDLFVLMSSPIMVTGCA